MRNKYGGGGAVDNPNDIKDDNNAAHFRGGGGDLGQNEPSGRSAAGFLVDGGGGVVDNPDNVEDNDDVTLFFGGGGGDSGQDDPSCDAVAQPNNEATRTR